MANPPKITIRVSALLAFSYAFLYVTSAQAMTGAEFLQMDKTFASGYAFGVLESDLYVLNPRNTDVETRRKCISDAKINSETLYNLVYNYIQRTPETLRYPALGAVIQAVSEMCK